MKKLTFLFLLVISIFTSNTKVNAQLYEIHTRNQIFQQVPFNLPGGCVGMVWNTTSYEMERVGTESDSSSNYTALGRAFCSIKYLNRDTINLKSTLYVRDQLLKFIVVAPNADTTIFIPTSGTISDSTKYTLISPIAGGNKNAITFYFDGVNYWITK